MLEFSNAVFAGGGSRCFWQAGFWSVFDADGTRTPQRVVGVSAGAAMACLTFSGRVQFGLDDFKQRAADNRRNFYPGRVVGRGEVFPHERIYRDAILATVDADALARLHAGPHLQIAMAGMPRWAGTQTGALAGLLAYNIEKRVRKPMHPVLGRAIGFRSILGTTRACATPEALADLILASSSTPPVTPVGMFEGEHVLDGGIVDNVPVHALEDEPGETLVLLSRRYPELPSVAQRTYLQPSMPIPVSMWDYTNPQALQDTFDLGRRDAETYLATARQAS